MTDGPCQSSLSAVPLSSTARLSHPACSGSGRGSGGFVTLFTVTIHPTGFVVLLSHVQCLWNSVESYEIPKERTSSFFNSFVKELNE